MGWNIDIKTDRDISEADVEEIIARLPKRFKDGAGRQSWGWSLAVDLRLRGPREIGLSGSFSMSGEIAEGFAEAFARRLEWRKIRTEVGEIY